MLNLANTPESNSLGRVLRDLEHIYELALAQKKLSNALRAKELIAKITGLLKPIDSNKKELLHLHELSDEQVELFVNEAEEIQARYRCPEVI